MSLKNLIVTKNEIYTLDLNTKEKRIWEPTRSKICAALKKEIKILPLKDNFNVLYLGCAEGYTCSFISDIVDKGTIFGVDVSAHSMQKFVLLCTTRKNLIPVLWDANALEDHELLKEIKVDVIIQDVAQKNQIEILEKNSKLFLKENGHIILSLKTTAISQKKTKNIIEEEIQKLGTNFEILEKKRLDPFEKKHLIVIARKKN